MWHNLMESGISLSEKVVRTVGVYFLLLILIRITGRRGLAGMNSMDLVVIFLLSNVVQNAVIGDDNSWLGGAVGAVTLVALNAGVNRLAIRYPRIDWLLIGSSVEVIKDGVTLEPVLRRYAIRPDDLEHAVHLQSGDSTADVQDGELTSNGQLILTLKKAEQAATYGDIQQILDRLDTLETRLSRRG